MVAMGDKSEDISFLQLFRDKIDHYLFLGFAPAAGSPRGDAEGTDAMEKALEDESFRELRREINEMKPRVEQLLSQCGVSTVYTFVPPAISGLPAVNFRLLDMITSNRTWQRRPKQEFLDSIDRAIGALKATSAEQLLNPPQPGDNKELLKEIEAQRGLMISVATGGPRIDSVNQDYKSRRAVIRDELATRNIEDPNPYDDMWAWYGKWSSGDLPSYQSRRTFITEMYQPLIDRLSAPAAARATVFEEPTGWATVDRDLGEMRRSLEQAQSEPQFQAVGLLCRETLITLGQLVFDPSRHPTTDGVEPSKTDAKLMLDAFIAEELKGGSNEAARRHAKAALVLANKLQHDRIADFRTAALCAEATTSVVNLIAIISGRRDP